MFVLCAMWMVRSSVLRRRVLWQQRPHRQRQPHVVRATTATTTRSASCDTIPRWHPRCMTMSVISERSTGAKARPRALDGRSWVTAGRNEPTPFARTALRCRVSPLITFQATALVSTYTLAV